MKNIIVLWSGAIADIPAGWALCDGNNTTPDLRDRFIVGAGGAYSPDELHQSNMAAGSAAFFYCLCYIMKL